MVQNKTAPASTNQSSRPYLIPKMGREIIRIATTLPVSAMNRMLVDIMALASARMGARGSDIASYGGQLRQ